MRVIKTGDLVWSTEHNECVVVTQGNETRQAELLGTDVDEIAIELADESNVAVLASSLLVATDKRCPDCQSSLFDCVSDWTYQYTCVICNKQMYGFEGEEVK